MQKGVVNFEKKLRRGTGRPRRQGAKTLGNAQAESGFGDSRRYDQFSVRWPDTQRQPFSADNLQSPHFRKEILLGIDRWQGGKLSLSRRMLCTSYRIGKKLSIVLIMSTWRQNCPRQ